MIELPAYRCDGSRSARQPVRLRFVDDLIQIETTEATLRYPLAEVELQPRLAGTLTQLRFPDGSQCDIGPHPRLDEALARLPGDGTQRFLHRLESSLPYIGFALIAAVAVLLFVIQYGVPAMARHIAHSLPVELEARMGEETLELFDRWFVGPSALPPERQAALIAQFEGLAARGDAPPVRVLFRSGEGIGPNAFALPSGIIVFTDELVAMAVDDREILGVFAHELGHVEHRHTLRHLLQNSATALLLVVLTGDVGSASSLAAALPTLLVQTKFSRDFENESDDYAVALLRRNGIDPAHLGDILARMTEEAGGDGVPDFLSTHPATEERVRKFAGHGRTP